MVGMTTVIIYICFSNVNVYMNNDDDDDFDANDFFGDFDGDNDAFDEEHFAGRHGRLEKFPLYAKAMEVLDTVDALCDSFSEQESERYGSILRESAMIIPAKIAGVFECESWLLCMQNASLIRYHAAYLHIFILPPPE
jgi:hypothetical protein